MMPGSRLQRESMFLFTPWRSLELWGLGGSRGSILAAWLNLAPEALTWVQYLRR